MTNRQLKKLKKHLPLRFASKIHEITGFSESHIRKVLNGSRINDEILNEAIKMAEQKKEFKCKSQETIKNL